MSSFEAFILITSSLLRSTIGRFFGWIIWFNEPIGPKISEKPSLERSRPRLRCSGPLGPSSEDQLLNAVIEGHHTEVPLYGSEET